MDQLAAMRVFLRVAESGSFSKAANALDLSRAMVSTQVAALERHYGVKLLNRTTRRVALTSEGSRYLEHCRRVFQELKAAEEELRGARERPSGRLRVDVPGAFGRRLQAVEKRLPEVNPDDLRQAWLGVAARARVHRHHRVTREELSVREHMSLILRRLQGHNFVEFEALFETEKGLPQVVVTFLALLELARESLVAISQTEAFAAIYVKLAETGGALE